ncbi:dihydroneopterin triphosphate diphosphatase [Chitinibacteraceae bacterium HSL-7]
MAYKQPVSVLVLIHTTDLRVLLVERTHFLGGWQSVTGSREGDEPLLETARREVFEETGLALDLDWISDWQQSQQYEIYERWRHRYAPGVTVNTEHVFSVVLPDTVPVTLNPDEHTRYVWVPLDEAIGMVFSPSNADALRALPARYAEAGASGSGQRA